MPSFKIDTYLYVSEWSLDSSEEAVRRDLENHGWTVESIEGTAVNGWMGAGGVLAEHHPTTISMSRLTGTKAQAEEAVSDAIRRTGNYSVASALVVGVAEIASGDAFEEDGRYAAPLSAFKLAAGAVIAVALVVGLVYAAPMIKQALATARAARGAK